jgi:ABC-2 type transport system ATP-binding protein
VLVRASDVARLAALLERAGARVRPESGADGGVRESGVHESGILVTGLDAARIGGIAAGDGIVLHELATRRASLEAAYLELTRGSVDFRTESASDEAATDQHGGAPE